MGFRGRISVTQAGSSCPNPAKVESSLALVGMMSVFDFPAVRKERWSVGEEEERRKSFLLGIDKPYLGEMVP